MSLQITFAIVTCAVRLCAFYLKNASGYKGENQNRWKITSADQYETTLYK